MKRLLTAIVILAGLSLAAPAEAAERRVEHRNYMAFGDSITYGIGTSDPATRSYPVQARVRGLGVGGGCLTRTTYCTDELYVLDWWPKAIDAMADRPDVAVFMVGTNDYPHSTTRQITAAMRRLVNMGKARGVRVVFGTITPAPAGSFWNVGTTGNGKATRLAVNDWIRAHDWLQGPEYARATQCGDRSLCPRFVAPAFRDVHGNDAFARVMADVLLEWIAADQ